MSRSFNQEFIAWTFHDRHTSNKQNAWTKYPDFINNTQWVGLNL